MIPPPNSHATPTSTASETEPPETPRAVKSVTFIPLSPKSSATLRRHREEQEAAKSATEDVTSDSDDDYGRSRDRGKGRGDHSSDRSLVSTRRPRTADKETASDLETDDEDVIEMLPDRFDAQGRPLDGSSLPRGSPRWHSRRGDFEYRNPRGADGFNMRGEWGIAGTDAEVVERVVQNVTDVLEGRRSWMGLIGGLLSESLLRGPGEDDDDGDERKDGRRRRRRREERGDSSRHGGSRRTRGRERDDYHDDFDDTYDDRRRRRRIRGDE